MNSNHRCRVLRPLIECGALGEGESAPSFFDAGCLDRKALEVVGWEMAKIVWDVFFYIDKKSRKFDIFLAVELQGVLLATHLSAALSRRYPESIPVFSCGSSGPGNGIIAPAKFNGKRVLIIGDYARKETVSAVSALLGRGAKPEGLVLLFEGGEEKNKIPVITGAEPGHRFLVRSVFSSKDVKIYSRMRENRAKRTAQSRV